MRNGVIRKKRLRAARAVDDFMRMPQRVMVPNIRDVNLGAFGTGRLWAIPH